MKIAGVLLLVVAFVVAPLAFLIPARISVMGTTGSCGVPVFTVFESPPRVDRDNILGTDSNEFERDVLETCQARSWVRIVVGAFLGGVFGAVGLGLLIAGFSAPPKRQPVWFPMPPPSPPWG